MSMAHSHGRMSAGEARTAGWVTSVCLHGALALGAVFFLRQVELAPQTKPFHWDVAMVEPVPSPTSQAATSTAPPTAPPLHRTPSPAERPLTATPVEPSRVEVTPRPSPAPVAPVQQTPAPTLAAPPPRPEPVPQPPQQTAAPAKIEPVPDLVREQLPTPPKTVARSEEPPKPAPAIEKSAPAASSFVQASESSSLPAESRVSSAQAPPASSVTTPPPVITEALSPHEASPTPLTHTAPSSDHSMRQETPATQQAAAPPGQEVASLAPPSQAKVSKPDDGWLADLMGKWIQDLEKHYPANLRTEGIQGKVVIVAILHDDGTLSDVKVSKSSGNVLLDQAAVSDVEKGPPIQLSRPLGRSQRPIKFSISYDLKTSR